MPNLHVLLATADSDVAALEKAAANGTTVPWIVPKGSLPGDEALFFVWGIGVVGMGSTKSAPKKDTEGRWAGRYRARVTNVVLFDPPLSEKELASAAPLWKWLDYPKMYTTPSEEISDALRALIRSPEMLLPLDIDLLEANEGEQRYVQHLVTERDPKIIEAKRRAVLRDKGTLACEVCAFDFHKRYGERGDGFCEVHHLVPLGLLSKVTKTRLDDLAIVCSNCHRIIHRGELLALDKLRTLLQSVGA